MNNTLTWKGTTIRFKTKNDKPVFNLADLQAACRVDVNPECEQYIGDAEMFAMFGISLARLVANTVAENLMHLCFKLTGGEGTLFFDTMTVLTAVHMISLEGAMKEDE